MKTMDDIAREFISESGMTPIEILNLGSLAVGEALGNITRIVYSLVFGESQYSTELQTLVGENIGSLRYNSNLLALTVGGKSVEELDAEYVKMHEATRVQRLQEQAQARGITLEDLLAMKKHVRPEALITKTPQT